MREGLNLQNKTIKLQKLMAEIEKYRASTILSILEIGKRWRQIRDEKLWAYMPEIKSFRYFIDKETAYSHGTVYNYIAIYDYYHDDKKVLGLSEPTRLIKALPYITEENKETWLHKAIVLNKNDYETEIRISKGQISQEDCEHQAQRIIKVCRTCNKKLEVEDM